MVDDLEKAVSYADTPVGKPTASLKGGKDDPSLVQASSNDEPHELGKRQAGDGKLEISIKEADVALALILEHDRRQGATHYARARTCSELQGFPTSFWSSLGRVLGPVRG